MSQGRTKGAKKLDKAMANELPPLALEKAEFRTDLLRRDEDGWSGQGWDQVAFHIAANPGSAPGPLNKIASGGELSRVMLALKVALAQNREPASLIFDEVDSGIGGAVADKVGERLARLAHDTQVIVVTHSPQVATRAGHHWRILKQMKGGNARTTVEDLDPDRRREEIARMLAGGEAPLYIMRRLVRFASEDIGLADPEALVQALAAKQAYEFVGSPEGDLALAQCVIYLATAPKSNAAYKAEKSAARAAKDNGSLDPPKHILNAPTSLMKDLGYGDGYEYDHNAENAFSGQNYFPDGMERQNFYQPVERGFERDIAKRLEYWDKLRRNKGPK